MLAAVDAHALIDPGLEAMIGIDLPPGRLFDQRKIVRSVAVDLVGRAENECRVGTVLPHALEQDERATGVDREIGVRITRGPVMRWLSGRVDDEDDLGAIPLEDAPDFLTVANIDVVVPIPFAP